MGIVLKNTINSKSETPSYDVNNKLVVLEVKTSYSLNLIHYNIVVI